MALTHGKFSTYSKGACRCTLCAAAGRAHRVAYNKRPYVKIKFQIFSRRRHQACASMLAIYKVSTGCVDCGYREHPAALHFDHRPGTKKKFNLALGWSRSWQTILDEIAKCDIRCANCHHVKTHERRFNKEHP
jgi:hypothetical protein